MTTKIELRYLIIYIIYFIISLAIVLLLFYYKNLIQYILLVSLLLGYAYIFASLAFKNYKSLLQENTGDFTFGFIVGICFYTLNNMLLDFKRQFSSVTILVLIYVISIKEKGSVYSIVSFIFISIFMLAFNYKNEENFRIFF